jgi:beta-galactosidase
VKKKKNRICFTDFCDLTVSTPHPVVFFPLGHSYLLMCCRSVMLFQIFLLCFCQVNALQPQASRSPPPTTSFHIQNDTFYYNQQPIQLKSGSIHYSRVPRAYWADRLKRMHALGLNAVQTYVMWNYHETTRGVFDFTKDKDLSAFLQACQDEGLLVLLRLGPYSCGEWEFGGFPAWMINHQPPVTLRTFEKGYISLVDTWWSRLLPVVKPHLISNGGSVVMVQVENEYGSYGDVSTQPNDLKYMHHLVALVRSYLGPAPQIYTTDGGNVGYMSRGTLNGSIVYTVGDHGPSSDVGNCQAMKEYNAPGASPCMDSEFYTGWLTHWGDASLANTSSAVAAQWIDALLTSKGNINMYMGHGGTSFGYWSGSNGDGGTVFQPDITSYDYDSPISEGGEHGYGNDGLDKYKAIQTVLLKHRTRSNSIFKEPSPVPTEPPLPRRMAYPSLAFSESTRLLPNALVLLPNASGGKPVATTDRTSPPSMEAIGQNYGFLLYETTMPPTTRAGDNEGEFPTVGFSTFPRDRAHVFVDSQVATTAPLYRSTYNKSVPLLFQTGTTLQILIENMGRLNYGTGTSMFIGHDVQNTKLSNRIVVFFLSLVSCLLYSIHPRHVRPKRNCQGGTAVVERSNNSSQKLDHVQLTVGVCTIAEFKVADTATTRRKWCVV